MFKLLLAGVCLLLLAACASVEPPTAVVEPKPAFEPEPAAISAGDYPAVAARYQVRRIELARRPRSRQSRLLLWRSGDRVETHNQTSQAGEIWRRLEHDEISYQRLFHRDQRIIDYTAGDLRALSRYPRWDEKASLIDPALLQRLPVIDSVPVLGHSALRYQGQIDGVDVELVWLADIKLPARVRYVSAGEEYSLNLIELYDLPTAPWQPADVSAYAAIDYADLGDSESDPFVRKVLHQRGGHHH